jgi:hypothetical protein
LAGVSAASGVTAGPGQGDAAGVAEREEFFFAGGGGDGAGEVAFVEIVAGLAVVGRGVGAGEVDGVGAEGDDGAGGTWRAPT